MDTTMQDRFICCFRDWVTQQKSDLDELLQALPASDGSGGGNITDDELRTLVTKVLHHFEDYCEKRRSLVREDPPTFFCPTWCSSFENSFLWIGGCRPTMSIRLVYAQSGSQLEANLDEFLSGGAQIGGSGGMLELSGHQLNLINDLHRRTLREEERLTARMATLQEDLADKPLLPIAMDRHGRRVRGGDDAGNYENCNGNGNGEVEAAMNEYLETLGRLLEEADRLRVRTVKELAMEILTPLQAVELLAAGKQLHLSVHAWGGRRDRQRGRGRG